MPNVNNMDTINAASTLNEIIGIATGQNVSTQVDASELISVGGKLLRTKANDFVNAMSEVMTRTIFKTERPYRRKFQNIVKTAERWGNHERRIGMISREVIGDGQFSTAAWNTENMYSVAPMDEVIQTNYYGKAHFEIPWKVLKNQLDTALENINSFNTYYAMQMQTVNNDWEQAIEGYSRLALLNLIVGVMAGGAPKQKINLLKEYNDKTGESLTTETVYNPDNYGNFIKFAYARIKTYMKFMTDRTVNFHTQFVDSNNDIIAFRRATPLNFQHLYMLTGEYEEITNRVLSDTFNEEFLNSLNFETVNYWQDMTNPETIDLKATYLTPQQTITNTGDANVMNGVQVIAVCIDDETVGMNLFDEWSASSPFEAHRGFINSYLHSQVRYWNSFEDNAIIFYLKDEA